MSPSEILFYYSRKLLFYWATYVLLLHLSLTYGLRFPLLINNSCIDKLILYTKYMTLNCNTKKLTPSSSAAGFSEYKNYFINILFPEKVRVHVFSFFLNHIYDLHPSSTCISKNQNLSIQSLQRRCPNFLTFTPKLLNWNSQSDFFKKAKYRIKSFYFCFTCNKLNMHIKKCILSEILEVDCFFLFRKQILRLSNYLATFNE